MRAKDNFKRSNIGFGRSWVWISAILYFCVMTCDAMSLTKHRLTPFKIKDLERGTYFKGNFMLYISIKYLVLFSNIVYLIILTKLYIYAFQFYQMEASKHKKLIQVFFNRPMCGLLHANLKI